MANKVLTTTTGQVIKVPDGVDGDKILTYDGSIKIIQITLTENATFFSLNLTPYEINGDFNVDVVGYNYESINNGTIYINGINTANNYFSSLGATYNAYILAYAAGYIDKPFYSAIKFRKIGTKYCFESQNACSSTVDGAHRNIVNNGLVIPDINYINTFSISGRFKIGTTLKFTRL